VRINGIVHLKSRLLAGQTVPIGWIAIGDPAAILPLTEHEKISEMLTSLNFRLTAYGIDRPEAVMKNVTPKCATFWEHTGKIGCLPNRCDPPGRAR
jgi:hypothetical protein